MPGKTLWFQLAQEKKKSTIKRHFGKTGSITWSTNNQKMPTSKVFLYVDIYVCVHVVCTCICTIRRGWCSMSPYLILIQFYITFSPPFPTPFPRTSYIWSAAEFIFVVCMRFQGWLSCRFLWYVDLYIGYSCGFLWWSPFVVKRAFFDKGW